MLVTRFHTRKRSAPITQNLTVLSNHNVCHVTPNKHGQIDLTNKIKIFFFSVCYGPNEDTVCLSLEVQFLLFVQKLNLFTQKIIFLHT